MCSLSQMKSLKRWNMKSESKNLKVEQLKFVVHFFKWHSSKRFDLTPMIAKYDNLLSRYSDWLNTITSALSNWFFNNVLILPLYVNFCQYCGTYFTKNCGRLHLGAGGSMTVGTPACTVHFNILKPLISKIPLTISQSVHNWPYKIKFYFEGKSDGRILLDLNANMT